MNTMLEVNGLYKNFKELEVLRGVSLKIDEGEVVAVIRPFRVRQNHPVALRHPAGAGATRGSIKICGEVLCEDSPDGSVYVDKQKRHELLLKMGLVFQSFNLFSPLQCAEKHH